VYYLRSLPSEPQSYIGDEMGCQTSAKAVFAGAMGKLEEFDSNMDNMAAYIERAIFYLDAKDIPEEKRAVMFVQLEGHISSVTILNNTRSLEEVSRVLLNHYEPKPLVILECFNFNRGQ